MRANTKALIHLACVAESLVDELRVANALAVAHSGLHKTDCPHSQVADAIVDEWVEENIEVYDLVPETNIKAADG